MKLPLRVRGERDPNPAASMALLDEVLDPPLGPGYYSAAQAREEAGLPRSSGFRTILLLVTSVLFGFLLTVAATTLRAPDPVAAQTRDDLVTRIEAAQAEGDDYRRQVEALRADILALEQAQAGSGAGEQAVGGVREAGALAGAVAVRGPGVIITMADAPRPAAGEVASEDRPAERVNARDLTLVVNGLWSAGAEAISVNDHRLTSTSAIRFAGQAIIVDFRGLTPPYEIRAIGDPAKLRDELGNGVTGAYLDELRKQLGLEASHAFHRSVEIGPAERLTTRVGHVPDENTSEENR
ncbi:DUF881 domain-containing protein [Ornithinimicrobium panacihumi]|uniref:DUF881 domain-containing protein n=1 Tax=Ornithinimicrobium panacihumi TaxID=2008449 RepID=UPI003F8A003F